MDKVTRKIPTPDPGGMDAPAIIEAFAHRMMYLHCQGPEHRHRL